MSDGWSDFEKYLIVRIDRLEERLTDTRIKIAAMTVIISLATSGITATVVLKAKAAAVEPAITQFKKE